MVEDRLSCKMVSWLSSPGQRVIILFVPEVLALHSCLVTILIKSSKLCSAEL